MTPELFLPLSRLSFLDAKLMNESSMSPKRKVFDKKAIQKVVQKNKTEPVVNSLNLKDLRMNDDDLVSLFQMLDEPDTDHITHLELSGNCITDKGIARIVPFFKKNVKIASISFAGNPITNEAVKLFLEILKTNVSCIQLFLEKTRVTHPVPSELTQALDRNREIQNEFEEFINYVKAILEAQKTGVPKEILEDLILEYVNGSKLLEARRYVGKTLYKKAMQIVKGWTDQNLGPEAMLENISAMEKKLKYKTYAERLKILYQEYSQLSSKDCRLELAPFTLKFSTGEKVKPSTPTKDQAKEVEEADKAVGLKNEKSALQYVLSVCGVM